MLQPNYQGIKRMANMCKINIPPWYHELYDGLDDDPTTRQLIAAATAAELASKLHDQGVDRFHF
jgi:methylenetetrahydrofolate reductase (NADPH)